MGKLIPEGVQQVTPSVKESCQGAVKRLGNSSFLARTTKDQHTLSKIYMQIYGSMDTRFWYQGWCWFSKREEIEHGWGFEVVW